MKTKVLLYGMQRSGTNFIETLLKKSFRIKFLNSNKNRSAAIQKHCRLYDEKKIIPEPQYYNNIYIANFQEFEDLFDQKADYYLIISKDPYSWYLSYKKWAEKCNWPEVNHHYIEEYNLFYEKFLDLAEESNKIIFIRYIDLLQNQEEVLSFLEDKMELQKSWKATFLKPKTTKVSQSAVFSNHKLNYYLKAEYIDKYSSEELSELNRKLDLSIVKKLGYSIYK